MKNLDSQLEKKIVQVKHSRVGKFLDSISHKTGGPATMACLNIACTAALGTIMTYPIYLAGGILAALPTGVFTTMLLTIIWMNIVHYKLGTHHKIRGLRKLLVIAILFTLPFGILSLPLLQTMVDDK